MPEQIHQGCEEGGNVRPACGFENFFHAIGFFLSANDTHAGEDLTRPVGGIELDREGDQIEEHDDSPTHGDDGDHEFGRKQAGEHADHRQPHDNLTGESLNFHHGHSGVQRGVGLLVLEGVSTFVGGHTQCGYRRLIVDGFGEGQTFIDGIVVVSEGPLYGNDLDVIDAAGAKDATGRFSSGQA